MEDAIPTMTKTATNFGMSLFNGTYVNFSDKLRKKYIKTWGTDKRYITKTTTKFTFQMACQSLWE